jgi:DNA-binding CsgD family transcriptional regulator
MTSALTIERVRRDVDVLSRAGLDLGTFVSEVDASLRRAVPAVATCYASVDPATALLTGTYKTGDLVGRDERDLEWGLVEYGTPEPTSFVEMVHHGVAAASVHLSTDGDVARSRRMREFIGPSVGYADELRVTASVNGRTWGGMALFVDEGVFGPEHVELMAELSRAIGLAFRSGLLARIPDQAAPVETGPTVLVVDAAGQFAMTSVGAEERLAQIGHGELSAGPAGTVAALVGAARRYAAGETDQLPQCRVRLRSGQWFVLHASPLASADGRTGHVVVTIDEARPPEIIPLVVEAFGLTEREREVTQLVLQGVDTKEIAATLCMSAYTVQDHLKSIFEKAGVRSRRELTARVFFDQYLPRLGATTGADGWFAPA